MNVLIVLNLLGLLHQCSGAKILFLSPVPAKSHYNLADRLVRELIKKDHQVTLVSPFQMFDPPTNLSQIIVPDVMGKFEETHEMHKSSEGRFSLRKQPFLFPLSVMKFGEIMVDETMKSSSVKQLLNSNEKFDLIMGECFIMEGLIGGFSHKYKAPIIGISPSMPNIWANFLVGNPSYPADRPDSMSFMERCVNFLARSFMYLVHYLMHIPTQDKIMRKHFGDDLPPLKSILLSKTSLVLVNHHYSLGYPKANLPNMVEVGSFHVKPPKPLPKDIQSFMDEAKDGVILFSMGSNLQSADFPEEKIQKILLAFGKLKQRVLWKFEKENPPNLPSNVKISKWLPQSDILAHPNIKFFITHGGIFSTTEAVLRGVPVVAIPIFADQRNNVRFLTESELGVKLEYDEISEKSLTAAANEVLFNPKYAKNMKERSKILQDVPIPQIDNAIFWIEYVIRHKGAPHLRSPAQDLSWYQMYLVDVLGFLSLFLFCLWYIFWSLLKYGVRLFCEREKKSTEAKKKD